MIVSRTSAAVETQELAAALAGLCAARDLILLVGDLGAGKTVFCKGVGEVLGIPADRILSPSFTIVSEHQARLPLCHVDLYRLSSEEEALDIGIDEILSGDRVCLVEWAEKIRFLLPTNCIKVTFSILGGDRRRLSLVVPDEPRFIAALSRMRHLVAGG